jgi:hypothetical protein
MEQRDQPERAALTRQDVIDDLVARLSARRSLAMRRQTAYQHLARAILDETTPVQRLAPRRVGHGAGLVAA